MEFATLANGVEMPMLGYGVFQIDDETTERCVADALDAGYRLIDTAQAYGNERGVGAAIAKSGVVRAIGVSNFDPVRLLDLCMFAKMPPLVNQVEIHAFRQQDAAIDNMRALGVQPMAWGPFAEGMNNFFQNPLLAEVGKAHGKTIGQAALRFLMDKGVVAIPKTVRRERMAENTDVFDFELTGEDAERIRTLDSPDFTCYDHTDVELIGSLLSFIKSTM